MRSNHDASGAYVPLSNVDLVAAPVAAAHVQPGAHVAGPSNTRLIIETANSSSSCGSLRAASAAHMNVRVCPCVNTKLRQHRLVELDEIRAGTRQQLDFSAQDLPRRGRRGPSLSG